MGTRYQFRCTGCTYRTEVSGGSDVGMTAATETVVCSQCKRLFDVVVSDDPGNPDAPRLPLRCPRARKHQVTLWKTGDPCPKCEAAMIVTGEVLWD